MLGKDAPEVMMTELKTHICITISCCNVSLLVFEGDDLGVESCNVLEYIHRQYITLK